MIKPNRISYRKQVFFGALFLSCAIFLPFVLLGKGYFIYMGDYNVQQIPFYQLAHQAVRTGNVFWNWNTDLGANFIGSYSFYLLFSPFFWLTLPFPTGWVPYLLAPLLALKTACAALTAYCYIERFVQNTPYAALGALLYAFSGWMSFNVFFNHFHEVAVFFPLLLLGAEKLVCEDNKAFFALAVAVNAAVNYWFFIGEVVFVVLYVFVRAASGWGMTPKKFAQLACESVLGVACAAVALLPSVLGLLGNPRTGTGALLSGWNLWLYWQEQRPAAIVYSLFFPPELQAFPAFFPDHGARWASLSAWLPMIACTGVLAFFFQRSRPAARWLRRMLGLCALFSMVPVLNSMFVLFNESYYARWFYMPILLMATATAKAMESDTRNPVPFRRALGISGGIVAVITLAVGLTPQKVDGAWQLGLAKYPDRMWGTAAFALAGLAFSAWLLLKQRHKRLFVQAFSAALAVYVLGFNVWYIACGRVSAEECTQFTARYLQGRGEISLPQDSFARADIVEGEDNALMFWGLPGIQAFHSIVPVSLMAFYPQVGVTRDVASRPGTDLYALRPLLSVRWLFIDQHSTNQSPMPGYTWYDRQNGFEIYENDFYIPMGFAYDQYVDADSFDNVTESRRGNLLLRAVLLEQDAIARHADILTPVDTLAVWLDAPQMALDARERRASSVHNFTIDAHGFSADARFRAETLVFFSVPWERGWTATVNGAPALIEKANIGFMAVRLPAGNAEIRFDYRTPGLLTGGMVSIAGFVILAVYALATRRRKPAAIPPPPVQAALLAGQRVQLSWDEYLTQYSAAQRRQLLQRAFDREVARQVDNALPQQERTLRFAPPHDTDQKL